MDLVDYPFTTFVKEHRPLRAALGRWIQPLENRLKALRTIADLDLFVAEELDQIMNRLKVDAPHLGGARAVTVRPPEPARTVAGGHVVAARHGIAIQVNGNPIFLGYWPDDDRDLTPVDDPAWPDPGLAAENDTNLWFLGTVDDSEPPTWALYSYLYLTTEEEARAAELDINAIFDERRRRIAPIVDRIAGEIDDFFATELPSQIDRALAAKRAEFETREAVTAGLHFEDTWHLDTPALASDPDEQGTGQVGDEELAIPFLGRLATKSFEDVQRTIRIWANSVERYPRAFGELGEDPTSDVLAATLNASLPAAHREVFSRSGKSDIFIDANILDAGAQPGIVFIVEAKWARGDDVVRAALEPQLFGYLIARDTAAVLLLLLPQIDRSVAEERYLRVLRGIDGFLREEVSAVEGWPIYVYLHERRIVRVCIAVVHLPRKGEVAPESPDGSVG